MNKNGLFLQPVIDLIVLIIFTILIILFPYSFVGYYLNQINHDIFLIMHSGSFLGILYFLVYAVDDGLRYLYVDNEKIILFGLFFKKKIHYEDIENMKIGMTGFRILFDKLVIRSKQKQLIVIELSKRCAYYLIQILNNTSSDSTFFIENKPSTKEEMIDYIACKYNKNKKR